MVVAAKLASAKCIAVLFFLFIVCCSIYLFIYLFVVVHYCLFNWSIEMAVLT